jgi:fibronectin type 3 domain-containing protein
MKKLLISLLLFAAPVFAQTAKTGAMITWQEATPGATFNVYRWDKSQVAGFTKINTAPITAMTYTDTTAIVGVAYAYKVTAVNSAGESAQSVEADITVSAPVVIPAVPTNLKVTVIVTN